MRRAWDTTSAARAKELEKAGTKPQIIWQETGTWKGPDGKWRQEISNTPVFETNYQDAMRPAFGNPNLAAQGQRYAGPSDGFLRDPQSYKDMVNNFLEMISPPVPTPEEAKAGLGSMRADSQLKGSVMQGYPDAQGLLANQAYDKMGNIAMAGMVSSPLGRIPETGVDTKKLADMLERAGVKSGYEVARESSAISPSQYITFRNPLDELATRQIRISNHADKYPEMASGVRQSVDPTTEISFEQAVNWLAKEGYPTNLSNKYKNVPSWEQYYAEQQSARDANRLQMLRDAWLNKPKATRGPRPTESDLTVNK